MAKVGLALATLVAFAFPTRAQVVKADSLLFEQLQPYARDTIEHIVCLYGRTTQDTVFLSSFLVPKQTIIGTHSASADPDYCRAAIAIWHDHAVPRDSAAYKLRYLYFTLTDTHSFIISSNAPYAIVGVDGEWCVWTRQQIQTAWARNIIVLPPVPEQCLHN